jgi:2-oxoglutarate ferredoxin oxidoreductase subunit gamma
LVNSTVFEGALAVDGLVVVEVPATDLAVDLGNIMTASMVMVGAYAAVTELTALESLIEAVAASLPSYRSKHVELNVAALRAGYDAAPPTRVSAWDVAVTR